MRSCAADLMDMLDVAIPMCKCTHRLTEHLPSNGCWACMTEFANDALHDFQRWVGEDDEN